MQRCDHPTSIFFLILKRRMFQHEMTPIRIKPPQLSESMKRWCSTINRSITEHDDSPKFRASGMKTDKRAAGQRQWGKVNLSHCALHTLHIKAWCLSYHLTTYNTYSRRYILHQFFYSYTKLFSYLRSGADWKIMKTGYIFQVTPVRDFLHLNCEMPSFTTYTHNSFLWKSLLPTLN